MATNDDTTKCRYNSSMSDYKYRCAKRVQEIATMRTWTATFNSASAGTKRMVLAALIDRMEVSRGYKFDITFNLATTQMVAEELS